MKESEKASGYADNTEEDLISTVAQASKFSPELEANAYHVSLFMQLLFQSGSSDSGSTILIDQFIPYTKIDIQYYGAFMSKVQKLGGVVDECQLMRGCLPSSVKLSAEEGGLLKLNADIEGAKWSNTFVGTAIPAAADALLKKTALKWQNAVVIMDDAYVTAADPTSGLKTLSDVSTDSTLNTRFFLQGFDLTIANGLMSKFYNSETIQCFILGKIKATGNFSIPWVIAGYGDETLKYYWKHINDFRNNIVKHIKIYWGSVDATTDNSLVIDMYVKYNSGTLEGDDVLGTNIGFVCVQPSAGTPAIKVLAGHTAAVLDRGLPAT